jgi:peptide-methionine (S)-S-oxide reductase
MAFQGTTPSAIESIFSQPHGTFIENSAWGFTFKENTNRTTNLQGIESPDELNVGLQVPLFSFTPMLIHKLVRSPIVLLSFPMMVLAAIAADSMRAERSPLPDPVVSIATKTAGQQTAVLAGGCFWGMEAVFEHLHGVSDVVSGYAGGDSSTAQYEKVGTGKTGHAEAVKITYDPSKISYAKLLKVYFAVAHDPTEMNRQGPDVGTQYRSAIFFANADQQKVAQAYIDQLNKAQTFKAPIATQLSALKGFYRAEASHQNFITRNPSYPYVVAHDLPKLKHLQKQFPDLYKP